tara:strand:- start:1372 stop:2292 length:921 start_codon:yes stop_codon:yes gene_type:complete
MKNSFYKKSTIGRLKAAPIVFRLKQGLAKANPYGEGSKHNMTFRMPSVDEIFDPKTNKNRKIQYVLGEESIFAKDQSDNPVLADIIFVNGALIVRPQQVNLLKYLEMSNYNNSNPNKMPGKVAIFYKVDVEADTKDTVEDMEVEADALYMARSMEPQKLVGYARTLGINVDRSMYEIKHDVMSFAKENPSIFLKSIDDPRTERKQVILDAMDYNILDFKHHANEINWVMGSKRPTIMHTPVGVEKLDYFVEYTFDSEGEDVYKEIQKRMKKMDSIEEESIDIPKIKETIIEDEVLVKRKAAKTKVK